MMWRFSIPISLIISEFDDSTNFEFFIGPGGSKPFFQDLGMG
jgi:hypothetical protein